MAYFPNGTSGMLFEEEWCCRCIHQGKPDGPGCPIMLAHILHNYDAAGGKGGKYQDALRETLDILIPEKDGFPDKCSMFVEGCKVHSGPIPGHLKAWADKQGLVEVSGEQFKTIQ